MAANEFPPVNVSDSVSVFSLPLLDHERLEVYQIALEAHSLIAEVVFRGVPFEPRTQLERASLSMVLNIAEGAGRKAPGDKRRFYEIARGSATECAAGMDVLLMRRLISPESHRRVRERVVRVVQMLTRLGAAQGNRPV